MLDKLKCPVCGKPLTELEYDKALGLWKSKQQHIKHLEEEQKKLKKQEIENKKKFEIEKRKLREKEISYKKQLADQIRDFKKQQALLKSSLEKKMKTEVAKGVEKGVKETKKQFKKQENELSKTKNKMLQLQNSLNLSAKKYEVANSEIKKLKEQIEKGITPQIEGLLEEGKLLAKLKELYPKDRFEHPGKGGDIIQYIIEQNKEIGIIVYECKKCKTFNKAHVEQAKIARDFRKADFAILVTNVFPSKKQFYFVENTVFVISPISLEPIIYTLRESLVKMALLKMSNEAKQKAVQRVYDYLSSNGYNNKMNGIANQLMDLGKDLKSEIISHKRTWEKRYNYYKNIYSDVTVIDGTLKNLVQNKFEDKSLPFQSSELRYPEIKELQ